MKLFKQKGYAGLSDKRGEKIYSQTDREKTDIEKLEEEIYWLKLENEALKKQMHIREEVKRIRKEK